MNNRTRQGMAEPRGIVYDRCSGVPCILLSVFIIFAHPDIFAQDSAPDTLSDTKTAQIPPPEQFATEQAEAPATVVLPDAQQMARALSNTRTRQQALLDVAVAAHVLANIQGDVGAAVEAGVNHTSLVQTFLDDRAWLQMLVDRYGWEAPRNTVLDPAAWLVLQELQQHDLLDVSLVLPGHMPASMLMNLVFQRADERLAIANLSGYLLEAGTDAVSTWEQFYELTGAKETADVAWKPVEVAWFTDRGFTLPPDEAANEDNPPLEPEDFAHAMSRQVMSAVDMSPPDIRGLQKLKYSMLLTMPGSDDQNRIVRTQARDSFYLVSLIDGLHDARYFDFVQGLLTVTTHLLELPVTSQRSFWLIDWLVAELPAISAHYAVHFAHEDPRLNAAMVSAFEVLQRISKARGMYLADEDSKVDTGIQQPVAENSSTGDNAGLADVEDNAPVTVDAIAPTRADLRREHIKTSRAVLADAVAQLALMIPDMGYYFDTPVRNRIVEEINICVSIAANRDESGGKVMLRRQFDGCMETLLQLADRDTRSAELSGNVNGPFTLDTLRRELNVTPWQRINYGIGYLHEQYSTSCSLPATPLPNPLEYAVLATTMSWFAEHTPEFAASPENEARLAKVRDIGEQLVLEMSAQTECMVAAGPGISDPVSRGMTDYELALRELNAGIKKAELDFRTQRLSPGADVLLENDATQRTSYRPDSLIIEPCDQQSVCEMSGGLSTTRALIGLFPNEYLIAEQTGLGKIEMCYRNMEWVDRRSELVRADDENVSNYYGHLGFDLVGRYIEGEDVNDIFAFRFTSPEEHHYLFAQTSEDVLSDSCPMSWVGSRVITPLREDRGGIVPDRLTYLAASRTLPSRLLQNNWDRGAEWRDWFVTGIGVSVLEVPDVPDIMMPLNQHLRSLYQAEQAEIYQRVLLADSRSLLGEDVSLFDEMQQVSITKALIRMQMILFYPESLFNSDSIRTSIAGDEGLLESRTMRRFRQDNVPMTSVNSIALDRLKKLRDNWLQQSDTVRRRGSIPVSLMNAMVRINTLYRQLYVAQPEPLLGSEADKNLQDQTGQGTTDANQGEV